MTLLDYLPIGIFAVLVTVFGVASLVISRWLSPYLPNPAKVTPYECGITPAGDGEAMTGRFPVKFYVIAMLFIVFDVETVFLFPWAVIFRRLGLAGVVEMGIFAFILFGAYIYVWRRGGLDWEGDV